MVTKKQPKQSKSRTELGRQPEKIEKKPRKLNSTKEKLAKEADDKMLGLTKTKSKQWVSSSNKKNRHGKTKKELTKSKSCNDCTGTEEAHVH